MLWGFCFGPLVPRLLVYPKVLNNIPQRPKLLLKILYPDRKGSDSFDLERISRAIWGLSSRCFLPKFGDVRVRWGMVRCFSAFQFPTKTLNMLLQFLFSLLCKFKFGCKPYRENLSLGPPLPLPRGALGNDSAGSSAEALLNSSRASSSSLSSCRRRFCISWRRFAPGLLGLTEPCLGVAGPGFCFLGFLASALPCAKRHARWIELRCSFLCHAKALNPLQLSVRIPNRWAAQASAEAVASAASARGSSRQWR